MEIINIVNLTGAESDNNKMDQSVDLGTTLSDASESNISESRIKTV